MKCVRCEREHLGNYKTCNACLEKVRKWNAANPERTRAIKRRSQARKYGKKVSDFQHLLDTQKGKCGICFDELPTMAAANQKRLHLDHDHSTGDVRGFLCGNCNTALGKFRDNPKYLLSAVSYLWGKHSNSKRFYEILGELAALHQKKQQDYGRGDDPFANVRASSDWGVSGWTGAMIRLCDKIKRLQSLALNGKLANESAEDSFRDIAVYSVIALVLFEQEQLGKGEQK